MKKHYVYKAAVSENIDRLCLRMPKLAKHYGLPLTQAAYSELLTRKA